MYSKYNLPVLDRYKFLRNFLQTDHYEAVTRAVQTFDNPRRGQSDLNCTNYAPPTLYPADRVVVLPTVNMPQYSISNVYFDPNHPITPGHFNSGTGQPNAGPKTVYTICPISYNAAQITGNTTAANPTWMGGYVINHDGPLLANTPGYATLLRPGIPYICGAATTFYPAAGQYCGTLLSGSSTPLVLSGPYNPASGFYTRDLLCTAATVNFGSNAVCEVMWCPWATLEGGLSPYSGSYISAQSGSTPGTGFIYLETQLNTSTSQPPAFTQNGNYSVAVVNRSLTMSIPNSTYGIVKFINGEWRVIWADC